MSPTRSAMSLLEVTISLLVFAVLMTMVGQSLTMGVQVNRQVSLESELTADADNVLQKIAGKLRSADYNWITINEGDVSTYTFSICTGLSATGPVFGHRYSLVHDAAAGTLTATLIEQATGSILMEDIAQGLRSTQGFRIGQLGTDVLVRGNQLQLTLAMETMQLDGRPLVREVTTSIFLRSTIYANTNLTMTHTAQTTSSSSAGAGDAGAGDSSGAEDGSDQSQNRPVAVLTLGNDNDNTRYMVSRGNRNSPAVYANNIQIAGTISLPAGSTDTINYPSFSLTADKASDGVTASYVVRRGWVAAENRRGDLATNAFVISGWVQGSIVITASVATNSGAVTRIQRTY